MSAELHRGQAADLVLRSDLNGTEKLLLLGYLSHQNSAHDVERACSWPGIDLLAEYAGVSRRSAISHRNALIEAGLLEVVARPQGGSLVCRVRLRPLLGRQLARPSTPTPREALAVEAAAGGLAEVWAAGPEGAPEAGRAGEGCNGCTGAAAAPVQLLQGGSATVAPGGVQRLHPGGAMVAPEPSSITFLNEPSSENPPHTRPAGPPASPAGAERWALSAPLCVDPEQVDVEEGLVEVDEKPAAAPASPTPPPKAAAQRRLRLDELEEDELLGAAAPGPAPLPGLAEAPPVPGWARKAGMPKARGSARELAGVVLRSLARVTGRPLPAPWGPDGGTMPGEGKALDPAATTLPKPVLALLKALSWPELATFEADAAAVADAARRCPDPVFARHLRAVGWAEGTDRSRAPETIFVQERWDTRLDAALAWRARGCPTAQLVAVGAAEASSAAPRRAPPPPRAIGVDDLDALFNELEAGAPEPSTPRSAACR